MTDFAHSKSALIGTSLFLSGLTFSIASVEMSSRFSIKNFAVDQKTLQSAADALSSYLIIAIVWTVATCLVLSAEWGTGSGVLWGLATNGLFVGWLVWTYMATFKKVAKERNLTMPTLFHYSK